MTFILSRSKEWILGTRLWPVVSAVNQVPFRCFGRGSEEIMAAICQFNSHHSQNHIAFFLIVFIFSSQGDSRLLDPTLLERELRTFAKDGLGVWEMQVRMICTVVRVFRC